MMEFEKRTGCPHKTQYREKHESERERVNKLFFCPFEAYNGWIFLSTLEQKIDMDTKTNRSTQKTIDKVRPIRSFRNKKVESRS